jgi:transposase-like protein
MENKIRLTRALIVGHGRDGRRRYDPEAKRELVKVCLQSGTSVARIARVGCISDSVMRRMKANMRRNTLRECESIIPAKLKSDSPQKAQRTQRK